MAETSNIPIDQAIARYYSSDTSKRVEILRSLFEQYRDTHLFYIFLLQVFDEAITHPPSFRLWLEGVAYYKSLPEDTELRQHLDQLFLARFRRICPTSLVQLLTVTVVPHKKGTFGADPYLELPATIQQELSKLDDPQSELEELCGDSTVNAWARLRIWIMLHPQVEADVLEEILGELFEDPDEYETLSSRDISVHLSAFLAHWPRTKEAICIMVPRVRTRS